MNYRREFEIGWYGLALGEHHFKYEVDEDKLRRMSFPEIEGLDNYQFKIDLKFDKKSSFFLLKFEIDGTAGANCDKCGERFDLEIWDEFDLVVKLTHDTGEQEPGNDDEADVVFIPRSETVIDVSEWIYEFLQLSIPIQLKHPDDENGKPTCNPDTLKILEQYSQSTEQTSEENEPPAQDPKDIWKGLDKFKF